MLKTISGFCAAFIISVSASLAGELAKPSGDVVLKVTGNISHTNADKAAEFDMPMLEALAGTTKTLETPWTEGPTRFSGPMLRSLLDAVGAKGSKLVVKALNDYSAEVPAEDAELFDTILAIKMNGDYMSVRDKGPLFLIYPFDTNPELFNEKYFTRSVWQIGEIEVVE